MSIVCHGTRIVAGNPGNSRPLRSSWTISGAKLLQKNDISKFLPSEMEEKCKKGAGYKKKEQAITGIRCRAN